MKKKKDKVKKVRGRGGKKKVCYILRKLELCPDLLLPSQGGRKGEEVTITATEGRDRQGKGGGLWTTINTFYT